MPDPRCARGRGKAIRVELIYDADCPNVVAARSALIRSFMQTGVSARWTEWDRASPESPEYARRYASPTILVEGVDVGGETGAVQAGACRVYPGDGGRLQGAPSSDAISTALRGRAGSAPRKWLPTAATLPAIGAMFVPKLACPLCIPIIGSAIGAAGFELFDLTPWVTGFGIMLVILTLALLAPRARHSGRWGPLLVAALGGGTMLAGKFALDSYWLIGAGMVVFVLAGIIGARIASPQVPCAACVGANRGTQGGID